MSRTLTDETCAALPGATWAAAPEGLEAWKVGGKMFACIGLADDGVSVKTPSPEDAALLIDMGRAIRAPYFHRSWVRVPWGSVPEDELRDRLAASYRIVRATLPKTIQAQLDDI